MATANYQLGYDDDRFDHPVSQDFHCGICLNVFKDPVMCRNNQHHFCRHCITKHLENSNTCPTCQDELTLETLENAQRIVTSYLSSLKIRCDYYQRGCREFVQLGALESHVKDCGFTPVMCSNEGCLVEINRRDRTHHESEVCEFRKVKCHDCVQVRRGMDVVKGDLNTVNEKLGGIENDLMEIKDHLHGRPQQLGDIKKQVIEYMKEQMLVEVKDELTAFGATIKKDIKELKEQMTTRPEQMRRVETREGKDRKVKSNVVVAGGRDDRYLNSVEVYNTSNETWTPLQPMKQCPYGGSSFVFKNQMITSGGCTGNGLTDSMEALHIAPVKNSGAWINFPGKLPSKLSGHTSIVHNGRLIVIGGYDGSKVCDSISEVLLEPPYTTKLLTRMAQAKWFHGAQLIDDHILIFGGKTSGSDRDSVDSVVMYDIVNHELKEMPSLQYSVNKIATVRYGENVIVIGGVDRAGKVLSNALIYNVKTGKNYLLPEMKYKRSGSMAASVDNCIVVIGGQDEKGNSHKSVERFSFNSYAWEDLEPMNEARWLATAVVC